MSRTKTVNGKRVTLGLKVSEAKAAAVDAARGTMCTAHWLEAAIDAALARQSAPEPATLFGLPVVVDARMAPGRIALAGPHGEPLVVVNVECRHDG
jgi:hypothetical protein